MTLLYNTTKQGIINPFHTFKNAAHILIALIKKRPFATIASIAIVMYSLKKARERYRVRSGQVRKTPIRSQRLSYLMSL